MQRFAGTLLPPLEDAMRQAGKPEEALFAFAFGIGTTLLSPDAVRLQRVVIAEVNGGNGGFAAAMYEFGSRQGAQSLAAYLASQVQGGAFAIEDTGLAAEQFLGAALAEPWRRAIFGVEPACDAAELERRVRQAVSGFMRQYQGNDVPPVSGTPPQSTR
jgi:AcrR family transcriptional regulator